MSTDSGHLEPRRNASPDRSGAKARRSQEGGRPPQSAEQATDRKRRAGKKVPPIASEAFPSAEPAPPPRVAGRTLPNPSNGLVGLPKGIKVPPRGTAGGRRGTGRVRRQTPAWRMAVFFSAAVVTLAALVQWMVHNPARETPSESSPPIAADSPPTGVPDPPPSNAFPAPERADVAEAGHDLQDRVQADLEAGRWESARERLRQALQADGTGARSLARNLLDELERASSPHHARRTLEQLTEDQLDRFMRKSWLPPAVERFSQRPLQERFLTLLHQHLPDELQRRHEQTLVEAQEQVVEEVELTEEVAADAADSPEPDPELEARERAAEQMAERGLERRDGHWLLIEDDDLAELVEEVNQREEASREAGIQWNELRPALHRLQRQREQAYATGQIGWVESLDHQIHTARTVQARWLRLRNETLLATIQAAEYPHRLVRAYQQLAEDPRVREAVTPLAPEYHRLGPTPALQKNARHIEGLRSQLLAEPVEFLPSDTERGAFSVGVILNEQVAETLAIRPRANYSLLAESLVRKAEAPISEENGRQLNLGGVRFFAPQATLPSLRIGRFLSRNVPVYVLPEAIGGRESFLSLQAFPEYRIVAEPGAPHLRIQSRAP